MGPPGGGRNPTDPRFVAQFNVYSLTPPTVEVLERIYSCIIENRFVEFPSSVKEVIGKFTSATLELFNFTLTNLPPTPAKFHYVFNLRDLSRIYEGCCLATPDYFSSATTIVRLWRNECTRIISDRLVDTSDVKVHLTRISMISHSCDLYRLSLTSSSPLSGQTGRIVLNKPSRILWCLVTSKTALIASLMMARTHDCTKILEP